MDWNQVIRTAKDQGWIVESTGHGGAVRLTPPDPDKEMVQLASTPSDVRAIRNTLAIMRRQGFIWPPPSKKELRSQRRKKRGK